MIGYSSGIKRRRKQPLHVVLHVGAFKTGTSYIQNVLWEGRDALAKAGINFPGEKKWDDQIHGIRELQGMRAMGPRQKGGWERLRTEMTEWGGPHAALSMEFMSFAKPQQARRIVEDLGDADVDVVITARDLARVVPASWQERVKNGKTWSWPEFAAAVRDPDGRDIQPGKGFWVQQDLASIARKWGRVVGDDRVSFVTVPPSGADPSLLLQRFGEAAHLDLSGVGTLPSWNNPSLGPSETEALRRLNAALGKAVKHHAWPVVVKRHLVRKVENRPTRPLRINAADLDWIMPLQEQVAADITEGGWRVVGDIADLVPREPKVDAGPTDQTEEAEVAQALVDFAIVLTHRVLLKAGTPPKRAQVKALAGYLSGSEDELAALRLTEN